MASCLAWGKRTICAVLWTTAIWLGGVGAVLAADVKPAEAPAPVSFYRQVRPLLQRTCSGCHQPAKASGKLLLTNYDLA